MDEVFHSRAMSRGSGLGDLQVRLNSETMSRKNVRVLSPRVADDILSEDPTISVELEQGRAQSSGKMQHALLKQSAPNVHCAYMGQAARHINMVDGEHLLVVNSEHKVDVFKRGDASKLKTLDIEYMRYSMVVGSLLFIGTEEKMLYMLDALTFEILDRLQTQSFIFTMAAIDNETIVTGEYQGYVDVVVVKNNSSMVKTNQQKLLTGNIYKIIKTDRPKELAFGCGNGLFFAKWNGFNFILGDELVFSGKYVTQICLLPRGEYLISIWNQPGVFIVDRDTNRPVKIEDPRFNSHTTDLKPLFADQFTELPYLISRNKNSINLIDLRNRHI